MKKPKVKLKKREVVGDLGDRLMYRQPRVVDGVTFEEGIGVNFVEEKKKKDKKDKEDS